MDTGFMDRIEELMPGLSCAKDFQCAASGRERLCKVKDIGRKDILECLCDKPHDCSFSLPLEDGYICQCPLRVYMVAHFSG